MSHSPAKRCDLHLPTALSSSWRLLSRSRRMSAARSSKRPSSLTKKSRGTPGKKQGSLHHTPEHCLVNGGFLLFWWKKHVSNGCKMYLLRSPETYGHFLSGVWLTNMAHTYGTRKKTGTIGSQIWLWLKKTEPIFEPLGWKQRPTPA